MLSGKTLLLADPVNRVSTEYWSWKETFEAAEYSHFTEVETELELLTRLS